MLRFILPFFFLVNVAFAQSFRNENFGATVGAVFTMGTHVRSVGISLNAFYTDYFFQLNGGTTLRYNLYSYGKRTRFAENRNHVGLILLAGKKESVTDFELDGLYHNTSYNYALGYNYLWYFDRAGTSQRSGGWSAHVRNFAVLLENDVFGGQAKDRFRTGHLAVVYRTTEYKIGGGMYIWTGETAKSHWDKIEMESCPSGFRTLDELPFGKTSHGNVYGTFRYRIPFYGQAAGMRIGIDSEHVRHYVQNRISHDLIFLPKKIKRNTPHYPRLDENGCPVFSKEETRRDRFYFQLDANENWGN
jgi:hypothetical protein